MEYLGKGVPVPVPSSGADDDPGHTPKCGCMVEIRTNGKPIQGPATVAVLLCPLHEAAPDLYAALKQVLEFLDVAFNASRVPREKSSLYVGWCAALAKARGEKTDAR